MKVIDMHCDTISKILGDREKGRQTGLRENEGHIDLLRMKKSGYMLQNFALFVDKGSCDDPWEQIRKLYRIYQSEMKINSDIIAPVIRFKDIEENEAAGKMSSVLTVEEGAVCKGEKEKLKLLYEMGVRMLTLTWNYPNELGCPNMNAEAFSKTDKSSADFEKFFNMPDIENGLTERGREFVTFMEELGMIPDVSHLSDAGFYDVLECTRRPFAASHSNARSVCRCVRNMSDDMIKKLAERGGVMGLNFCADFLREVPIGKYNPGDIEAVVDHARYITNLGGTEVLGLGSDFDGIDNNEALPGAECAGRLWDTLKRGGYSEDELDKIFYKNVLRLYRDTLK